MAFRDIHSGDKENDTFNDLLNKFDAIEADKPKAKDKWVALADEAKNRSITFRQKEAIIERCKNQINGTFGKSKKAEHYSHTKTS